jgi:hypothetical protein
MKTKLKTLKWIWVLLILCACQGKLLEYRSESGASNTLEPAPTREPAAIPFSECVALGPAPQSNIIRINVAQASQLASLIENAPTNSVILLADGTYPVTRTISLRNSNVSLRSESGVASRVILDAQNGFTGTGDDTRVTELFVISAPDITLAELTLQNAGDHLIHFAAFSQTLRGIKIYNVNFFDAGSHMIKANYNGSGFYTDGVDVSCSHFELTARARPWMANDGGFECSAAAISATSSSDWSIRHNVFKGLWCTNYLASNALYIWLGSRDFVIEGNRFINVARAIALGHNPQVPGRNYSDSPCGGLQNMGLYGATVRNNMILENDPALFASTFGFDVGIGIEDACDLEVAHNTVMSTGGGTSIEWRFPRTTAKIFNNLTSGPLRARDGAIAQTQTNLSNAPLSYVLSTGGDGDLHLSSTATNAIGAGSPLPAPINSWFDFDNEPRKTIPDLGADEL